MNIDRVLGLGGIILGVIPFAGLWIRLLTTRRPARRFLGLDKDRPVEVIVSTSATRQAADGEAKSHTTAVGELRAVAVGARTVLPLYRHKKMSVFMSAEYPGRLQADVLLLGGPLRNRYSETFLDFVNRKYPSAQLTLDARACLIGLGGRQIVFDQRSRKGVPREDLALLVLASDAWSTEAHQRVVLCAGLSTYGTEGAARFLFQRLLGASRESVLWRRQLSGQAVAAIVHVMVERGRSLGTELYEDLYWSADGTTR